MSTFGIDLGTTYSCVSYMDESGTPVMAKNQIGEDATPSVVYFQTENRVVVGREAKEAAKTDAGLVVSLIKRHMGKRDFELEFHGVGYSPESISAFILRDLMRSVRQSTGRVVRDAVITVPAYFGLAERQATRVAGELAGLNVLSLVPEPVAAALHYGMLGPDSAHTILVYDLGGGTFDTTVMQLVKGDVRVVCTDGNYELGGADWDERVSSYLLECFVAEYPDSGADASEEFRQSLDLIAEQLKVALSVRQSRRQPLHFNGLKMNAEITRATFEERTADLLARTLEITQRTLDTARKLGVGSIDNVLLVGGSARMPAVAYELRRQFGFEPQLHDPDLAVAKGAAIFALREAVKIGLDEPAGGSGGTDVTTLAKQMGVPAQVVDAASKSAVSIVVPRAFGVAVVAEGTDPDDGKFEVHHLLHANDPLPAKPVQQVFHTAHSEQRSVQIEIYEQAGTVESRDPDHNSKIGEMAITRLPPLPKNSPINIIFSMDENGLLHVEATELVTGRIVKADVQIGDLTPARIDEAKDAIARMS
jgi:molecular chaperone DnaK